MADLIDGIWGVIRNVIITVFVLALCVGIAFFGAAFIAGQELERKQRDGEWETIWEGRPCDVPHTNGVYTLQIRIKEN